MNIDITTMSLQTSTLTRTHRRALILGIRPLVDVDTLFNKSIATMCRQPRECRAKYRICRGYTLAITQIKKYHNSVCLYT